MLFALSYDYVGDLSETVALMWPTAPSSHRRRNSPPPPTLDRGRRRRSRTLGKTELPRQLARWLDELDETGRWALLKLVTGGLRIGVSARLAKTAAAALGDKDPHEIEVMWPGLDAALSRSVRLAGGPRRQAGQPRSGAVPPGDAGACDRGQRISPRSTPPISSPNGNGTASACRRSPAATRDGHVAARLYSRTGEDISDSFPDLLRCAALADGAIDGELLVMRDGRVQSLQRAAAAAEPQERVAKTDQGLSRSHLRAYDLLGEGDEDLRELPFAERRARLEAFVARARRCRASTSRRSIAFDELGRAARRARRSGQRRRRRRCRGGRRRDAQAPRRALSAGPPEGPWWKWKRDPHIIDAVLMYAQRGHGKRSSFYSDYTFGVWTRRRRRRASWCRSARPISASPTRSCCRSTASSAATPSSASARCAHVVHEPDQGLVLEVAFEGLQRSTRHKSGVAMRFPRINRLRWDKPPREADRLETLERMLKADPAARGTSGGF